MKTFAKISEIKTEINRQRAEGKSIGFVPTMGFLHEGHLSLVRESLQKTDCTVVSIFVNPTQFGPQEDFKKYPRDLERDADILEKEGVGVVFVPDQNEMYPQGYKTFVEVQDLQDKLCGISRPRHFKGVCTVVLKLFQIVGPDIAFFGQKDAQQALILKRMVRDLNLSVDIDVLPIVREADGLALSSRNVYLNTEERKAALCLIKCLKKAEQMIKKGERKSSQIIQTIQQIINSEPMARMDYVEIVDLDNLDPLDKIEGEALIALAVYVGKIRLIDNMIVILEE
ncbi:pantoate--beta-alanine ligase [candidate division WOR-1 bacterium DG_54_3]|uniref:Pantothenate synthetase n=1 Tax=candidate division WOR-1 bacterium DG_54_3 TaxID=1703775 RepID=A0A0S7Y763_UNCSA|nr:MAG: pantoate--beta-alanine ligase [candidate division WOR-1 bacterium DG_54_3]